MAIFDKPTYVNTNSYAPKNGPLGTLYSDPYNVGVLQYPADLGSAQKGHIVVFTACVTDPLSYTDGSAEPNYTFSGVSSEEGDSFAQGAAQNADEQTYLTMQPKRIRSTDIIQLYMPDTINFQYNADYSDTSLADAATNLPLGIGDVAKTATSAAENPIIKTALGGGNYAFNPQQQLLFTGIGFRTYQMAFSFTPSNSEESAAIQGIIYKFRYHAAPQIGVGIAEAAFKVPDTFLVEFQQLGYGKNPYVTKLKESVLKSVDVNYSPNGIWSTHDDGSPTQINLTLQFQEIALIDKTAIYNGF